MTASDRRISQPERRARLILAEAGCQWLPAYNNGKVIPRGAMPTRSIPTGNAHVVLTPDLSIVEVDDEAIGLSLYQLLLEDVPTLEWRSQRGPKKVMRMPPGAQRLKHGAKVLSGLEILTDRAMAPGSTVDHFYLHIVALRPIATLEADMATELAWRGTGSPTTSAKT